MRRGLVLAVVTAVLCSAFENLARADGVESLLSTYEAPPPPAGFERFGPETARELMEVVLGEQHRPSVRLRAISALASFPTRTTRRFLETLLESKGVSSLFRRKAALALATGFGEDAVLALEPHLSDEDPRVRDDVARALALAGGRRAAVALERHRATEPRRFVLQTIDAARAEVRP